MIYYRVIGKTLNAEYVLGYTSNKWAWIRNANGWKKDQLVFEILHTTDKAPIRMTQVAWCPR